jgi:hypothetical protein
MFLAMYEGERREVPGKAGFLQRGEEILRDLDRERSGADVERCFDLVVTLDPGLFAMLLRDADHVLAAPHSDRGAKGLAVVGVTVTFGFLPGRSFRRPRPR